MTRGGDFWSRRKARVEAEEAEAEAARARSETEAAEAALAEKSDAEICADLDLPDPDTLGPGDDVRAFMAQAVPDRLRRRALRQLWRTNPALANLDALVDYGEDYTDAARVVANLQTAYQVGRGFVSEVTDTPDAADTPDRTAAAHHDDSLPDDAGDGAAPTEAEAGTGDVATAPVAPARQEIRDNSPSAAPREFAETGYEEEECARPVGRMRFAFAPQDPGVTRDQETP